MKLTDRQKMALRIMALGADGKVTNGSPVHVSRGGTSLPGWREAPDWLPWPHSGDRPDGRTYKALEVKGLCWYSGFTHGMIRGLKGVHEYRATLTEAGWAEARRLYPCGTCSGTGVVCPYCDGPEEDYHTMCDDQPCTVCGGTGVDVIEGDD